MAATKPKRPTRADRPKKNFSPEARQKLSELAKQRHAEGKLGGSKFGKLGGRGNTKEKRRAASDLAEAIRDPELVQQFIQTLKDSQDPERPMKQRMDGVKLAMEIEREDSKLTLAEEKAEGEEKGRDELIRGLLERLTVGPAAAMIRNRLLDAGESDIVEAEVVDEADGDSAEAA